MELYFKAKMTKLFLMSFFLISSLLVGMDISMDISVDSQATEPFSQQELPAKYSNDIFFESNKLQALPDDILENIKKQLIGDDLQTAEEFQATLDIEIGIKNIIGIYKTSNNEYLALRTLCNIHVVDLNKGQVVYILKHRDEITGVAISNNGQFMATSSNDGTSKIYYFENQDEKAIQHNGRVTSVAISPDDKFVFTSSEDRTAKVSFCLPSEKLLTITIKSEYRIIHAIITHNSKYVIMLTFDGKIKVFNTTNYEKFDLVNNYNFDIEAYVQCNISTRSNDRYLFFYHGDALEVFDIKNKSKIDNIVIPDESNDKKIIKISGDARTISIKNLLNNEVTTIELNNRVEKIKKSLNENHLIIITSNKKYRIYDLRTNQEVYVLDDGSDYSDYYFDYEIRIDECILISQDSKYAVIRYLGQRDKILFIHDLENNLLLEKKTFESKYRNKLFFDISPNNKDLIINLGQKISIYNLQENKEKCSNICFNVAYAQISKNGRYLAMHMEDMSSTIHRIVIFDLNTYQIMHKFDRQGHNSSIGQWHLIFLDDVLINNMPAICYDKNKISIHRFDQKLLHDLTILQIKLITWLHTQKSINKIRADNNQEIKPIILTKSMTDILNSLPPYVKKALLIYYNNIEIYDNSQSMSE